VIHREGWWTGNR